MTLQLGSAELLFKDTSATDFEVSLPYIDDISPRELKAAEVMVKEEVRHFFSTRGPIACSPHSIVRSRFATKALVSRAILLRFKKPQRDVDDRFWTLPPSLKTDAPDAETRKRLLG